MKWSKNWSRLAQGNGWSSPQAVKNALHLAGILVPAAAAAAAAAGSPPAVAANNSRIHANSVGVSENDTADMLPAAANTAAEGVSAAEGEEAAGVAEAEEEAADDPAGGLSAAGLMRRVARLAGDE